MDEWEYKVLDSKHVNRGSFVLSTTPEQVEEYLNGLGSAGWEVVSFSYVAAPQRMSFIGIAKRRKTPSGPNATLPTPAV